jgi:hypothetical protein
LKISRAINSNMTSAIPLRIRIVLFI